MIHLGFHRAARRVSSAWTGIAFALMLPALPVAAQAPPADGAAPAAPVINAGNAGLPRLGAAVRVEEAPVIDGRLDDEVWALAEPLMDFVQHEPPTGAPLSEATEVRVLFDDRAIYIGARMYDREPERIVVGERRRNANLSQSDAFLVVLDTFRDQQNAFVFGTNPGGIEYDGQVRGGGGVNTNWNGSWTVATSRDAQGWTAEMRIPFSTLRYGPAEQQIWGLNMARYIGRRNEQGMWSPVSRQYNLYRLTEAGVLAGIEPPPARVTSLTPYVLGSMRRGVPGTTGTDYDFDVGGEAKIGITPSLVLDLTVNTDFAQVEVDDQQVDLSRFNLFFPERRPFFLENADLFTATAGRAGAAQFPVQLFHSRRIGVTAGQEVPIRGGARLSGRLGGTDLGLLYMQTDGLTGVQDPNAWGVARVVQELPNRSRVGGIFTSRSSSDTSGDYNRAYGIDGRLGIGDEWTLDALVAYTETPGLDGDEKAISIGADYQTEAWRVSAYFDHVGDAFNPEVGFLRRDGYRERLFRAQRTIWPRTPWIREMGPHARYTVSHDLDGFKETEVFHFHLPMQFENGARINPSINWEVDGLTQPFRIAGTDIVVPPGTYSGWNIWSNASTNPANPVSANARLESSNFLSGDRVGLSGGVTLRQGGTLSGSINVNHNRIRLPQGDFNTTLTQLQLRYAFTPSMALQSSVQYSDQTGVWTGQMRFSWMQTAGTGLFLVYNERRVMEVQGVQGIWPSEGAVQPERTFAVKYTHQFDVSGLGFN